MVPDSNEDIIVPSSQSLETPVMDDTSMQVDHFDDDMDDELMEIASAKPAPKTETK